MQKVLKKKFYITRLLDNGISDEENPTSIAKKSINRVTDLDTQQSKEEDLFTSEGDRGEYLQAAYSYLGTILPTNVGN